MLDRLVIGTANFGRDYNGHYVDGKEQQLIMEYMKEVGIEWLDVATAYGTENYGIYDFARILKVPDNRKAKAQDIVLSHDVKSYKYRIHDGVSIDKITQVSLDFAGKLPAYLEIPYSVLNRNDGCLMMYPFIKLIARSIFCKGKALKYFSPQGCIDFVLMNPRIDKVIIGVDSVDQLRENIKHLVRMEKFTHGEEVDTRKFERKEL